MVVYKTEALVHLRRGLDPYDYERYIFKLMKHKPTTMVKAYELASHLIMETEAMRVMKQTRNPPQRKPHNVLLSTIVEGLTFST